MSSSPTDQKGAAAGAVAVPMPKMGISVAEGTIAAWLKGPGDEVADGETICEVTTDKIDVEIPAPGAGVLSRILAEVGETVEVGATIAEIAPPGTAVAGERPEAGDRSAEGDEGDDATAAGVAEDGRIDRSGFHSPVVKRIAERHGIDLASVSGTGVGGRIRKRDLLALIDGGRTGATEVAAPEPARAKPERALHSDSPYRPDPEPAASQPAAEPGPAPVQAAGVMPLADGAGSTREPMSAMRRTIARRMVDSLRTSAQCTTVAEVDMGRVLEARRELAPAMAARGVSLTPLAFVARAVCDALGEFPMLNASVDGDELVRHADVDLGIAVSVDDGLLVPVIRRAQRLGLEGLAAEIAALAGRARSGELEPDDVAAGTFTITNPGRYGAVIATPVINQPQVAILDLEAIVKRAVVREGPDGDAIAIRPIAYMPMSWDHRALDGVTAARFLGAVRERLEGGAW